MKACPPTNPANKGLNLNLFDKSTKLGSVVVYGKVTSLNIGVETL